MSDILSMDGHIVARSSGCMADSAAGDAAAKPGLGGKSSAGTSQRLPSASPILMRKVSDAVCWTVNARGETSVPKPGWVDLSKSSLPIRVPPVCNKWCNEIGRRISHACICICHRVRLKHCASVLARSSTWRRQLGEGIASIKAVGGIAGRQLHPPGTADRPQRCPTASQISTLRRRHVYGPCIK